jgi:hypothetical protein
MAHPADELWVQAFKKIRIIEHLKLRSTVFSMLCWAHLTTKHMRYKLCAIANAEYRYAGFKQPPIALR